MCSKSCDQRVNEAAASAAILIVAWIVDGNLEADRLAGCQDDNERLHQLVPGQAARHSEINRRHDGIVEAVGIQVDKETGQLRPYQMVNRRAGGASTPKRRTAPRS